MVEKKAIVVEYVPTKEIVTDILTKELPKEPYERFMDTIGLHRITDTLNTAFACTHCSASFHSNNKLHKHIRIAGHGHGRVAGKSD